MSDEIIDAEATFIGDMHRALVALQFENRAMRQRLSLLHCGDCGHDIDTHDDSGCVLDGCDCRKWVRKPPTK
jgi:hypothetical protein